MSRYVLQDAPKPKGRPKSPDPLLNYQVRFPASMIEWLKANGGGKKLRELVRAAQSSR